MGGQHPSDYRVEFWDAEGNTVTRVMAICDNLLVGIAAYDASLAAYPRERITLRHGARVIRENNSS